MIKRSALLVGWNGEGPDRLGFAQSDAARMQQVLERIGFDDIRRPEAEELSAEAVLHEYRELGALRPALLLCYFAGHGTLSDQGLVFGLPHGVHDSASILLPSFLQDDSIVADTDVLCVIDTCMLPGSGLSGSALANGMLRHFTGRPPNYYDERAGQRPRSNRSSGAIVHLLAASTTHVAYEDSNARAGVFTAYLIEELDRQVRQPTRLDMQSIFAGTESKIRGWVKRTGRSQSPLLRPADGGGVCLREHPKIRPYVSFITISSGHRVFAASPDRGHVWSLLPPESRCYEIDCQTRCASFSNSLQPEELFAVGESRLAEGQRRYRLFCDRYSAFLQGVSNMPKSVSDSALPWTHVAFSADVDLLAASTSAGEIVLWDIDGSDPERLSLRQTGRLQLRTGIVALAYADDDMLVVAAVDGIATYRGTGRLRHHNVAPAAILHALVTTAGGFMAWTVDRRLLSGDIYNGILSETRLPGSLATAVAVSQDGSLLAQAEMPPVGGKPLIRVWRSDQSPAGASPLRDVGPANTIVTSLAFTPNMVLYYATSDGVMERTLAFDWQIAI